MTRSAISPKIEVRRSWSASNYETASLQPARAAAALLVWTEPEAVDGGPGERLARALAQGLTSLGEVTFRWRGPAPSGMRRPAWEGALPRGWAVLAASSAEAARQAFEIGWAQGDQNFVLAHGDERKAELAAAKDLRGAELKGDELVFNAALDGTGALLAAASGRRLEAALEALSRPVVAAGFDWKDEQPLERRNGGRPLAGPSR